MSKVKKRFWSDDEKREICGQARMAGVSVAQVARRYSMNANLIHKWLKDARFAPVTEESGDVMDGSFLPVEVLRSGSSVDERVPDHCTQTPCATRVDLTLSDGRRVLIEGPTALSAVLALVEGLMV